MSLQTFLRTVYGLLTFSLPIFAAIYVVQHANELPTMTPGAIGFLESTFFLVILLNLFFLILYNLQHNPSVPVLLSLILGPIIGCTITAFADGYPVGLLIAEIGMTYVIELTFAFGGLVSLIAIMSIVSAISKREWKPLTEVGIAAAQGLFIIPGVGATWIFGKMIFQYILPHAVPANDPYHLIALVVYAAWIVPVVQNIAAFFTDFKNESIIA